MSRQSPLASVYKGDNEEKPGAVHGSAGIYLTAQGKKKTKNLRKETVWLRLYDQQRLKWGLLLQSDVCRIEKEWG